MPPLLTSARAAVSRFFGYDATDDTGRRRVISHRTMAEDHVANERKRRILASNARDLERNFSVAAWAIRKHLDYVSSFSFSAHTDDRGFNRELEEFVRRRMTRDACDLAGRHPFRRLIRLTEACAVKDGDVFLVKLAPAVGPARGRLQAIEADRVINPKRREARGEMTEWVNGVRVTPTGRARDFAIHDRVNRSQTTLRRIVPARNVLHHAFYGRFDAYRGVSPIASALNWFRDTYEGLEYAHAKVKLSQLFGLKFTRDAESSPYGAIKPKPTTDADGDGTEESDFKADLPTGIFSLDLDVGEDADVMESKTPSSETVDFLKLMILVALKSLDIPFSFFDESFTNFYGSRGGLIQYLHSCRDERESLAELQNNWAAWNLGLAIADGDLKLPSGKDFDWLKWEFVPDGVPWWDPVKEARGQAMSIAIGASSPQRVCREIGTRFEQNIDQIAEAIAYAKSKGVDLHFADSTAFNPSIEVNASDAKVD